MEADGGTTGKDAGAQVIWQICKDRAQLPEEYRLCRESWLEMNPDWHVALLTNPESRALFSGDLPEFLEVFDQLPLGVMKADMWRYAALLVHGGIYADIDTYCRAPIESWLTSSNRELLHVCCEEATPWFCQWTIAAPAGHPVLRTALELIAERVRLDGGVDLERNECVHYYTGPDLWSEAIKRTLGTNRSSEEIRADRDLAASGGILVHPTGFFANGPVSHGYASFTWGGDTYTSWRDEMQRKIADLSQPRAERLKELLIPRSANSLKRYGGKADGTFVLSEKALAESAYVLSLGNDDDFDLDVADTGIQVMTVLRDITDNRSVSLAMLVDACDESYPEATDETGAKREFSMKIDVEGSEYRLLDAWLPELSPRCAQISIEFHNLPNGGVLDGITIEETWEVRERVILKLLESYHLVHLHGNNHKGLLHGFPEVVECLFIHKSRFDSEPPRWTENCPNSALDGPNRENHPDLVFGWWT